MREHEKKLLDDLVKQLEKKQADLNKAHAKVRDLGGGTPLCGGIFMRNDSFC